MVCSAFAGPLSDACVLESFVFRSANRTYLTRSEIAVHDDQFSAVPFALVFQHTAEFAPSRIAYAPCPFETDAYICFFSSRERRFRGVGRLLARPTATLSLEAQQRRELKQKMFGD